MGRESRELVITGSTGSEKPFSTLGGAGIGHVVVFTSRTALGTPSKEEVEETDENKEGRTGWTKKNRSRRWTTGKNHIQNETGTRLSVICKTKERTRGFEARR